MHAKPNGTATAVFRENGHEKVVYHETVVASMNLETGEVTLNSGGYRTVTTKRRMNQALAWWGRHAHVYQHKGDWHVLLFNGADPIKFADGMTV